MKNAVLEPTAENTYRIAYTGEKEGVACDFRAALGKSHKEEEEGNYLGACETRFSAVQEFMKLIPEDLEIELDWNDPVSRDAVMLVNYSAIDHFLIGDFEITAAMLEMVLDLDPEDHLEATKRLAYTYIALEEYELFDEIIADVNDKSPDKMLLTLWSGFRRSGGISGSEFGYFKSRFAPYYDEFIAGTHPADEEYLKDIESDRPSKHALARELWFQTEHLWIMFPGFIESIREYN